MEPSAFKCDIKRTVWGSADQIRLTIFRRANHRDAVQESEESIEDVLETGIKGTPFK